MNSPKNICLNCGKNGHMSKTCHQPIVSYGIICFKLCNDININNETIEQFFYNKFIDISDFNYQHLNNIKYIPDFYNKIKLLMIRRKSSLNFVEFVRGKYDINNKEHLLKIFKLMTRNENILIKIASFDVLWNELWQDTATLKIYQKEFKLSKNKYNELKKNNFYGFLDDNNLSQYIEPEWGFPKGRKNINEKNLKCAVREFSEETNCNINDLHILERLNCLEEDYEGSNMIKYKHVYYIASIENNEELKIINMNQQYEISDIKWFTISEAVEKIRPYYVDRIKIIFQIYFFILNLITNITPRLLNNKLLNNKLLTC
jgi:ADP-ribose pyrophosphatase YjhB (NUDIX family)